MIVLLRNPKRFYFTEKITEMVNVLVVNILVLFHFNKIFYVLPSKLKIYHIIIRSKLHVLLLQYNVVLHYICTSYNIL